MSYQDEFDDYTGIGLQSVTVHAPPVRLVLIQVVAEMDDGVPRTRVGVYPVVGIETAAECAYTIAVPVGGDEPPVPASHDEFIRDGWEFLGCRVRRSVQYISEFGTIRTVAQCECCLDRDPSVASHIAACPWPDAEDAERLRSLIARLTERAEQAASIRELARA